MKATTTQATRMGEQELNGLPEWIRITARHVEQTNYGQVILTIHQGEVIEVQKVERIRFNPSRKQA